MYADDTAILARNKNPNYIQIALNRHLKALEDWFIKWKIEINVSKTEAIMFANARRVQLAQWLASPLRNWEVASSMQGCDSYSVFAIICNKFARQACGKLAASSFHGDFGAFLNLLQAYCKLALLS
ncbi:hypothetical protein AVEN_222791-1 [Araneus ventricosus]|uniref:Reverse transcriptase domain-containing protein n=1 Tax=Araneus ventricosus TaxID=182803 RepID=A0A4Y2AZP8_ARAVE|nr:hypothetical protein AVEN_222791-1 [Araneus ventricosus]